MATWFGTPPEVCVSIQAAGSAWLSLYQDLRWKTSLVVGRSSSRGLGLGPGFPEEDLEAGFTRSVQKVSCNMKNRDVYGRK